MNTDLQNHLTNLRTLTDAKATAARKARDKQNNTTKELTSKRNQLNKEVKAMKARHEDMTGVFQAWVDLAPAMGMIGTLIGLVAMLGNMADPKAIGPAMAVALLTTLYGAMIANCIFMPIVTKLEGYSAHELLYREMVVMGLKYISRGESPRNITDQLVALMPPKIQAQLEEAA